MFMFDVGVMTKTTALGLLICTAITSLVARFVLKLSCNICWNVWSAIKDLLIVCFLCFNPCSSHKLSLLCCLTQLLHLPYAAVETLWLLSLCELPAWSSTCDSKEVRVKLSFFYLWCIKTCSQRLLWETGISLAWYYFVPIFKTEKYTYVLCPQNRYQDWKPWGNSDEPGILLILSVALCSAVLTLVIPATDQGQKHLKCDEKSVSALFFRPWQGPYIVHQKLRAALQSRQWNPYKRGILFYWQGKNQIQVLNLQQNKQ